MNRIHEDLKSSVAIVPAAQAAAGNTTSAYVDASEYNALDFVVSHGALAATKKVTVQLYQATANDGTGATEITGAKQEIIAPTGGLTSGIIVVSVRPQAAYGKYFAVKVTNDAAAALLLAATAHGRVKYAPAVNDNVSNA